MPQEVTQWVGGQPNIYSASGRSLLRKVVMAGLLDGRARAISRPIAALKVSSWRLKEFLALALDPEHCAMPLDRPRRRSHKSLVRRQPQNKPTAIGKAIKPNVGWPRRSSIDVDDIGGVELHSRAIAVDTSDVALSFTVCCQLGGKGSIILNRGHPPAAPHQMCQNCGVVADPCANVDSMIAGPRSGARDEKCMQ